MAANAYCACPHVVSVLISCHWTLQLVTVWTVVLPAVASVSAVTFSCGKKPKVHCWIIAITETCQNLILDHFRLWNWNQILVSLFSNSDDNISSEFLLCIIFNKIIVCVQVFYNNSEVKQVDVPSLSGSFGILPNHVPLIAVLKPGVVTVHEQDGSDKRYFGTYFSQLNIVFSSN